MQVLVITLPYVDCVNPVFSAIFCYNDIYCLLGYNHCTSILTDELRGKTFLWTKSCLFRQPVLFFLQFSISWRLTVYLFLFFFSQFFTATFRGGNQFAVASNATNFDQSTAIMICKQHNAKLPRLITTKYLPLNITNGLGKLAKVSKQHLHFWVSNTTTNGLVWAFDADLILNSHQKIYEKKTVKFVACETGKLSTDIFQKK